MPRDGFEPTTLGLEVLCSIQAELPGLGAGGESRTPVPNLEGWDNGRYTTPATGVIISPFGFFQTRPLIEALFHLRLRCGPPANLVVALSLHSRG